MAGRPHFDIGPAGYAARSLLSQPPPLVVVALGSNLGPSAANVRRAFTQLQKVAAGRLRRSSLWLSTPVACPPGSPCFINAAALFHARPRETPESLLRKLQAIERRFGRQPKRRLNEPRPLDLDLIVFGLETRATAQLCLPHPRAHRRRFVLQPLAELAPDLILPGQRQSVAELLTALDTFEELAKVLNSPGQRPSQA